MADATRPALLFYCQHSLGIGHLTRSLALAAALAQPFRVVFLNGGRMPPGLAVPPGIETIDLPPLGMDDGHTVVSRDAQHDVDAARRERRRLIDAAIAATRPAVLLVELFPFGRKKFAGEILPMIRAVRRRENPALVVCSLRDILVDARPDQQRHDDRARWLVDRYFDAVIVHADPAFARLEDTFRPSRPLRTPVFYSGFVAPARARAAVPRGDHLLVSAGGGIVGEQLFRATLAACARLGNLPLRVIAGPFLPEPAWQALQREAQGRPGVALVRQVGDMVLEMRRARASISQCGYNTALDLVLAEVPALVVPYQTDTENEQSRRALRLAALGAVLHLPSRPLTPERLSQAIAELLAFRPLAAALAVDGARRTAGFLERLHARRADRTIAEPA